MPTANVGTEKKMQMACFYMSLVKKKVQHCRKSGFIKTKELGLNMHKKISLGVQSHSGTQASIQVVWMGRLIHVSILAETVHPLKYLPILRTGGIMFGYQS